MYCDQSIAAIPSRAVHPRGSCGRREFRFGEVDGLQGTREEHKRLNVGERVRGSTPNNQAFARARDSAFTELLLDTQYRGLLYTLRGITSPCLLPPCAVSPMWDAPPSMAPRSVCKDECARERLICPSLSR